MKKAGYWPSPRGGGGTQVYKSRGGAKPFFGFEICGLRTFFGFEIL